jgi:uncharacterized damage-inducible protein DinB
VPDGAQQIFGLVLQLIEVGTDGQAMLRRGNAYEIALRRSPCGRRQRISTFARVAEHIPKYQTSLEPEVSIVPTTANAADLVITRDALLEHWQGHRRLTRRVIEAFPEDQLFTFSIGGMRTFGELAMELLSMAVPTVRGIATQNWDSPNDRAARPTAEVLRLWDESTEQINAIWSQIPQGRFQETMTAFGQWPGRAESLLFYVIDNEIHHRGQGYVYLRALGVEPPPFYER